MKTLNLFLLICILAFASCKEQKTENVATDTTEVDVVSEEEPVSHSVEINAADYSATNASVEMIRVENDQLVVDEGGTWTEYNVEIPTSGRYKFEVTGAGKGTKIWMEDYVDNTDGRTYNITGGLALNGGTEETVSVDGSPLNEGLHKMRLHVEDASASISSFKFTLIKELVKTPEIMTQNMKGQEWELVWSDEFDEGTTVDTEKWTYDIGNWGWGNNELQYYTVGENATIEDGNLVIEARLQEDGSWTSTRLTTREKTSFVYGRIEFRAKVPVEKGNWSAGWTLGDSYVDEISWPYCGEIDIMESVGYEIDDETGTGKAHASIHVPAYYFKLGNQPTSTIDVDDMKNEYHTYRIDWSREKIIAYVDDEPYFEFSDTSSAKTWPFNEPQNIILNLAMGGGWGGLQGMDTTVTTQKLYVDYVRVYGKKESEE
jgi:beta-glucanase (GH16 family)